MADTKSADLGSVINPSVGDQLLSKQSSNAVKTIATTDVFASAVVPGAPLGAPVPGLRWKPCSKREPCPICGRTDGKCRARDGFHHCWKGDRFSPPNVLINDVVQIAGRRWKKIADHCGFAKNSVCFVEARGSVAVQAFSKSRAPKAKPWNKSSAELVFQFLRQADQLLSVLDFETASPDELQASIELVNRLYAASCALFARVRKLAASSRAVEELMPTANDAMKAIEYQKRDVDSFLRHELGDPVLNQWVHV